MKILVLFKNKAREILTNCLIGCLAVTFNLTSCQKEDQSLEYQTSTFIEECRVFYESQVKGGEAPNTTNAEQGEGYRSFPKRKPLWEKALARSLKVGQSVAVPLSYEGNAFAHSSVNNNELSMDAISYLLVYKDSKKAMHAEIISIFHDAMGTKSSETDDNSFIGVVLVDDLNGKFIKGFWVLPPAQPEPQNVSVSKAECFVVEYYTVVSLDGGITWGSPRLTGTRIECGLSIQGANDGDGGGGNAEDYLITGGGGVIAPAPRNLTAIEVTKLTNIKAELAADCANGKVVSKVWNGMNFAVDGSIKNPAQWERTTNTITFKSNNFDRIFLMEELFHAYQNMVYPGGIGKYSTGKPGNTNIEFEAKLFNDIYTALYGGIWMGHIGFPESYMNSYQDWVYSISMEGFTPALMSKYSTMLGYFNQYSHGYGGYLLPGLNTPVAIIQSKSDCN